MILDDMLDLLDSLLGNQEKEIQEIVIAPDSEIYETFPAPKPQNGNVQELSFLPDTGVLLVFGKRGSGKSNYIKWLISNNPERFYMIWDSQDDYNFSNACYYATPNEFLDRPVESNINIFRGIFSPEEFFDLCESIPGIVIVCDELDLAMTQSEIEYRKSALYRLINFGRHNAQVFIGGARTPPTININIRANEYRTVWFHMRQDRYVDYAIKNYGTEFSNVNKLKIGECIYYPTNAGETETARTKGSTE